MLSGINAAFEYQALFIEQLVLEDLLMSYCAATEEGSILQFDQVKVIQSGMCQSAVAWFALVGAPQLMSY